MAKKTLISWTDHTWNPWEGCDHISPGCDHCYMFAMLERFGKTPNEVRRTTTTWKQPYAWNWQAQREGAAHRVFTCSLSDFFHKAADPWREEAWQVIRET